MKNKITTIVGGLLLIAAGIVLGGNILGVWDINIFFPGWWTLFIIVPGLLSLINSGPNTFSTILIVVGVFLLLGQYNLFNGVSLWKLIVPAILIIIGIQIIINRVSHKNIARGITVTERGDEESMPEYTGIFGGFSAKNRSQNLCGGNITGIFGGGKADLSEARVQHDIKINVTTLFGGVDIIVPQGVRIETTGVSIFGGTSNKTIASADPNLPLIVFNCTNIFGGTDLK